MSLVYILSGDICESIYNYMTNRGFERLFSNRPDSERISHIKDLGEFINEYPGEELLPNLFILH